MNRRGFFGKILGFAVGLPIVKIFYDPIKQSVVSPLKPNGQELIGCRGGEFLETGFVYAPYIPIYFTNDQDRQKFRKENGIKPENIKML